jgi:hypothetical protein
MNIVTKRIFRGIAFAFACVGCGFIAITLLPTSSILLRAGTAGVVSGLAAAILMRAPWFRGG